MERPNGFVRDRVEYIYNERVASNGDSISEAEIMDLASNSDASRRGKVGASRMEHLDDYNSYSRGSHSRSSYELNVNRPEYVNFQGEEISNTLRSRPPTNQWGVSGEGRFGQFPYLDQGQPGYGMSSYYERVRYQNHGLDSFENLENNRVELLRKLDELEDQLSRSCEMADIPQGRATSSYGGNKQHPDDMASQYASPASGFAHFTNRHDRYFSDPYPQRGHPHESCVQLRTENSFPSGSYKQRSQNEHSSSDYHHYPNPIQLGPQGYSPGGFNLHPSQSPARNSTEHDGFNHNRPVHVVDTHRGQVWHPIAGGAPIVACFNCFELLKLPRKHLPLAKTQHKLKCGACSTVFLLQLGNGGSAVPDSGHVDQVSTEIEDASSLISNENVRYQPNSVDMSTFCDDYDHPDPKVSAAEKKSVSGESEKQFDRVSEDGLSKSKRFDLDQNTPSQDSGVATEISLNSSGFVDQSEEHNTISIARNSFTESRQDLGVNESLVFVNGHFIPEYLVQKAEKLAGPIQHGQYWYDVHAGFWGVMGHPCLGIIMPNIEEFNYPMPENCGAGNTGVFVNGRELHQKDLAVLAGRGLPDTKHGSYRVKISGKVVDDHTGEELHSLGRLAPTVERAKHGFGMKVPRFIARLRR